MPSNLPDRNNNPLNVKYGPATKYWVDNGMAEIGDSATDGGNFLKFKSPEIGFLAAGDLLDSRYSNESVDDALQKWSNKGYGASIASGIEPGSFIKDLTSEQRSSLLQAMAKREGWSGGAVSTGPWAKYSSASAGKPWEKYAKPKTSAPNTRLASAQLASKSELEANKPESTLGTRTREAAIGLLEPFTIPSLYQTGKSAAGALSDIITGKGTKSAQELVQGAVRAPSQPLVNLYEGLTEEDYDKMAYGAGGFASQTAPILAGFGENTPTIGDLREAATARGIPERLQARAAENKIPLGRQPWQERALIMGPTSAVGYSLGGPLGAAAAATGAEGLALIRRSNWYRGGKARLMERASEALTDPNAKAPPVRTPTGIVKTEIPFNPPAGTGEAQPGMSFREPIGPREEIPFNPTSEPSGSQPNFRAIEEKIAPSGTRAKQSSITVDADGNPTSFGKRLVEVVPEIATVGKGARADAALMDGYKRTIQHVNEVEDAIPEETTVDPIPITSKLSEMSMDYLSRGLDKTAKAIDAIRDQWMQAGDRIPWGEFLARKRAFFKEHNLRSAPMRRAYGLLMEAAGRVSPELAEANSRYSVVRRALDNAHIDVNSGRRIADVGTSGKSSAMKMSERGEPPQTPKPATAPIGPKRPIENRQEALDLLDEHAVTPPGDATPRDIPEIAAKFGSTLPNPEIEASAASDMQFFADDIRQMQAHREKVSGGGASTMESNVEGKAIEEDLSAEWSKVGKSLGLKPPPGLEEMSPGRIAKAIEKGSGADYERVKKAFIEQAKAGFSEFRESQRESGIGPGELRRRALGLMRQRLNKP